MESLTQEVFGVSHSEFEARLAAWRDSHQAGTQVDDLRLTAALQALRRQYQDTYAPPPLFIFGLAADTYARPENILALLREPRTPAHVAVELLIASGQVALAEGRYDDAQAIIDALEPTLQTGTFEHPLAADHFAIVTLLAADEQQVVSLTLAEDEATASVIPTWPAIEDGALQRMEGTWQIAGD